MSDAEVLRLIEEMEGALEAGPTSLEAEAIENWHRRFLSTAASAERGADWPAIVERARAVAERIQATVGELGIQREDLRRQMAAQATGHRALKAYRPPRA